VQHRDREQRLIHRLESFSDTVIGFSLALLALTLALPGHFMDLITDQWWLAAYIWSFMVIARIWLSHQQIFAHYFVVNRLTLVLNFVVLGSLGLMIYFVQVFVHLNGVDKVRALLAYFIVQSLVFLAMGLLCVIGTRARWAELDAEERAEGIRQSLVFISSSIAEYAAIAYCIARGANSMTDTLTIAGAVAVGLVLARVIHRMTVAQLVR
jgi:uncharacterized membrane protein